MDEIIYRTLAILAVTGLLSYIVLTVTDDWISYIKAQRRKSEMRRMINEAVKTKLEEVEKKKQEK